MAAQSRPSGSQETEVLCIYGFAFEFPALSTIEFDPKFKREKGDLAIKAPSKSVVFLSWGDLGRVVKRLPTPMEHSKYSVERVAKSVQGKATSMEQKEVSINGHRAVYSRSRVDSHGPLLGGGRRSQEIESLHVHCDRAMRYYVIYTSFDPTKPKDPWQEDAMKVIAGSFKCHP